MSRQLMPHNKDLSTFLTLEQIRAVEVEAIHRRKLDLMELAASQITAWVMANVSKHQAILVLVGSGNNGGDGIVVATSLHQSGYDIRVMAAVPHLGAATAKLLATFIQQGGKQLDIHFNGIHNYAEYALIIDAIFGIGINAPLSDTLINLINSVNHSRSSSCTSDANSSTPLILAVDTPSGLNPFSGEVYGAAINATHTITFISNKPGFYTGCGLDLAGTITVAPLVNLADYSEVLVTHTISPTISFNRLDSTQYQSLNRSMHKNTHKGNFGTVAVVGGNVGMNGALYLAAHSALLLGSGKVLMAALDSHFTYNCATPELMTATIEHVLENMASYDVIIVGPGFGINDNALDCLRRLITLASGCPAKTPKRGFIFDADALNLISMHTELHQGFKAITPKIITPHPAEAGRLLGVSSNKVQSNRFLAVGKLATQFDAITLLKGSGSLICANSDIYINQTGNPALANAGQGDTLCGIIAALLAQNLTPEQALCLAVYIQGSAADTLANSIGYIGISASEIAVQSRSVLNNLLIPNSR